MDDPIPYLPTDKTQLISARGRIADLEHMLRHFDRTSMDLHLYCHAVEGVTPTAQQWQLVLAQIRDMVAAYGGRNPNV